MSYDWKPGDRVEFCTFDHYVADIRELDGTTATVLFVSEDGEEITVNSQYGEIEVGKYDLR